MKTLALLSLLLGQTVVTPQPCLKPVQKLIIAPSWDGGTAFYCPDAPFQTPKQRMIELCNRASNLGQPRLYVRYDWDGGWPVASDVPGTANANKVLNVGDCVRLYGSQAMRPRCIMSAVDAGVEVSTCE